MSTMSNSDVYYDSADYEIARNPYAVFKRLRDEGPQEFYEGKTAQMIAAEMQLFGDCDEISEVAKLHGLPSGVECPWSIAERAVVVCTASAQLRLRPAPKLGLHASRREAAW